jgi:hypothetical protein
MNSSSNLTEADQVKDLLTKCINDFLFFAPKQLKIATKGGGVEPLILNKAQLHIHEKLEEQLYERGHVRAIILKGRQQGASTYIEARFYHKTRFRRGVKAFILTHLQQATDNLFAMVERYHNNLHPLLRPKTSADNANELFFEGVDSGYKVSTAGSKGTGRGSTIHYFHGSEVAFWPNAEKHAAGVLQAVPFGLETEVILESTANGIGGYFHTQWRAAERGESDFIPIFVPWFWQDEYRRQVPDDYKASESEQHYIDIYKLDKDQAYWMHKKNIELDGDVGVISWLFLQEYPFCPSDAFQASGEDKICSAASIAAARICKITDKQKGAHVLGVDPARFGNDRSSWIHRNRRVAYDLRSFTKLSTTELASRVAREIERCKDIGDPLDAVLVDVVGLGAGVVDSLNDMGYRDLVIPVNAGERADDPELYFNKRVEMWDLMSKWLDDIPVSIPDSDTLNADLMAPKYSYNTKQQKVLETKDQMRKRGEISPDEAEALALTFARSIRPKPENDSSKSRNSRKNWRTG